MIDDWEAALYQVVRCWLATSEEILYVVRRKISWKLEVVVV